MSADSILFSSCLYGLGLILLLAVSPAKAFPARLAAAIFLWSLALAYIWWRWTQSLPTFGLQVALLWAWFFFALEMMATVFDCWSLFVLLYTTNHSPQADTYERQLRSEARDALPSIDVFIATFNESPRLVAQTVNAALNLIYPPDKVTIWVLDDGAKEQMTVREKHRSRQLQALEIPGRVRYLRRPWDDHKDFKAGNLNYALRQSRAPFLIVLDADFVIHPNFIYRTLGFLLHQPEVGLVQTPQNFRNPDPIQWNLLGSKAWVEEQNFFMKVYQAARDYFGNAFCVGTSFIIRRASLDGIGGFARGTLAEDMQLSYELLNNRIRTLYLNEPLSHDLAPETVPDYVGQRVRWMIGCIQHLFLKTGPVRSRHLTVTDRLFCLEPILYWMTMPFVVALLIAPIIFWFSGVAAIHCPTDEFLMLLIARSLGRAFIIYWLSSGKVMPLVTLVSKAVPAFHLSAGLVLTLVRPFGPRWFITGKNQPRNRVIVQWKFFSLFFLLAFALVDGMLIGLLGVAGIAPVIDVAALDVLWSIYALLVLVLCAVACVDLPVRQGYEDPGAQPETSRVGKSLFAILRRLFA